MDYFKRIPVQPLPEAFTQQYGTLLPNPIWVRLPTNQSWIIDLEHRDNRIWLARGRTRFCRDNGVKKFWYLVWEFNRTPTFNVSIFNMAEMEISYALVVPLPPKRPTNCYYIGPDQYHKRLKQTTK